MEMQIIDFFPPVWNGTLREHYLVLFTVAGGFALIAGLVGAWLGARFGTRRVVHQVLTALPADRQQELTSMQLSQLANAVDAMSLEVERLSEGQRFTAKLLTDRIAASHSAPAERPQGVITPH
jgi:hypothetical protein